MKAHPFSQGRGKEVLEAAMPARRSVALRAEVNSKGGYVLTGEEGVGEVHIKGTHCNSVREWLWCKERGM